MKAYMCFCMYLKHNSLFTHMNTHKHRNEEKLQTEVVMECESHTLCSMYFTTYKESIQAWGFF
jgi:hypothetical protein